MALGFFDTLGDMGIGATPTIQSIRSYKQRAQQAAFERSLQEKQLAMQQQQFDLQKQESGLRQQQIQGQLDKAQNIETAISDIVGSTIASGLDVSHQVSGGKAFNGGGDVFGETLKRKKAALTLQGYASPQSLIKGILPQTQEETLKLQGLQSGIDLNRARVTALSIDAIRKLDPKTFSPNRFMEIAARYGELSEMQNPTPSQKKELEALHQKIYSPDMMSMILAAYAPNLNLNDESPVGIGGSDDDPLKDYPTVE